MGEILIQYVELSKLLLRLNALNCETGYKIYSTSEFINLSRGEMFEAVNELYVMLEDIETTFCQTISDTIQALNIAGHAFSEVEQYITNLVEQIT